MSKKRGDSGHLPDNMTQAAHLAGKVPGLLLQAEKIAHTVMRGVHGRRRVGQGETFWQFREYQAGDSTRDIDWRQTAKRDEVFIRQLEWEASQTVWLYRDASPSMDYHSSPKLPRKKDYAEVLMLALSMIILDGGEQISLLGTTLAPQAHAGAAQRIYDYLPTQKEFDAPGRPIAARSNMIMISDFYFAPDRLARFCAPLAEKEIRGLLVQITDPAEETLPFSGRVKFHDIENLSGGNVTVEQVDAVREEYMRKFAAHREELEQLARRIGWRFIQASTADKPEAVLARIYDLLSAKG